MSEDLLSNVIATSSTVPDVDELTASNARLGVWLWLASDCALFASLIATYLTLHGHASGALTPKHLFDLPLTTVATFALLASSMTMGLGVEAARRGTVGPLRRWLLISGLLGLVFVSLQVHEFMTFWHKGLTFGSGVFGDSFYILTGFHGLHVLFGVTWLAGLLWWSRKLTTITPNDVLKVEVASLYWYFVDVVWVVLFTVIYLLGVLG